MSQGVRQFRLGVASELGRDSREQVGLLGLLTLQDKLELHQVGLDLGEFFAVALAMTRSASCGVSTRGGRRSCLATSM